MAVYCVQADLEIRFTLERVADIWCVQASDGSTTGVADPAAVVVSCTAATTRINRALGGVYIVPFVAPIDDVLIDLACDLAIWLGIRRRPELITREGFKPYLDLYKDAILELELIRTDKARISQQKVPSNAGGTVTSHNPEAARPFYFLPDPKDPTKGGMRGY